MKLPNWLTFNRLKDKKVSKPKPEIPEETVVTLNIYYSTNDWVGWQIVYCTPFVYTGYMNIPAIKSFYKWYFGRLQSKHYRLTFDKGEYLIIRDKIQRVHIGVKKRNKLSYRNPYIV